jgi:hypothetical protein
VLIFGQLLVLAGYTLIYAGVANGGVLASNPAAGLTVDAYTGLAPGQGLSAAASAAAGASSGPGYHP